MEKKWIMISIAISLTAVFLSLISLMEGYSGTQLKIGFINTSRLMTSFKEAHVVDKEIKAFDDEWKGKLQILEDSLKAFMDAMSKKYDKTDVAGKRQLQDELAAKNQQINNFTAFNTRKVSKLRMEKMQRIYDKVNAFMKEYGDKNNYDMIFGTVQGGNILYGENRHVNITQEIIDGLNKRYE